MASQAYYDWVRAGKPYNRSAPVAQLRNVIQGYGFTVYDYPDDSHQKANLPEDHTAYSATGWPVASPRWWAFAIDVMPGKGGMSELADMAMQIIRDKDAGVPGTEFIKYINWTDKAGKCWHTSWKPGKSTVPSTDKGHNHISGRSDFTTRTTVKYDPIARMRGAVTVRSDEDMAIMAEGPDGALYFCIGGFSHPILASNIGDIKYVASQGAYSLAHNAKGNVNDAEWTGDGWVRKGWSPNVFGPIWYGDIHPSQPHGWALATRMEAVALMKDPSQTGEKIPLVPALKAASEAGAPTDEQVQALADSIAAKLEPQMEDAAFKGAQRAEKE